MTEAEQITTYTEDFDAMRTRLIGMGAGNRAVAGTVVNGETGGVFNTLYFVDEQLEPPVIAQFSVTERARGLTGLTRIAVTAEDQPMVAQSRHTVESSDDPGAILKALMQEGRVAVWMRPPKTGKKASPVFSTVFANVMAFEPYS
ncbi:MAG: hypothetical protein AAB834_05795 [Patescibacteria group bacterium]